MDGVRVLVDGRDEAAAVQGLQRSGLGPRGQAGGEGGEREGPGLSYMDGPQVLSGNFISLHCHLDLVILQ
jgi:hypothetical protein